MQEFFNCTDKNQELQGVTVTCENCLKRYVTSDHHSINMAYINMWMFLNILTSLHYLTKGKTPYLIKVQLINHTFLESKFIYKYKCWYSSINPVKHDI